jgi:hypothetical protein
MGGWQIRTNPAPAPAGTAITKAWDRSRGGRSTSRGEARQERGPQGAPAGVTFRLAGRLFGDRLSPSVPSLGQTSLIDFEPRPVRGSFLLGPTSARWALSGVGAGEVGAAPSHAKHTSLPSRLR